MDELVEKFSLERVSKSPSVYDRGKLRWMSGQYIRRTSVESLFPAADPYFPESIRKAYDEPARRRILALLHEKIETLSNLTVKCAPFEWAPVYEEDAGGVLKSPDALPVIDALENRIRSHGGELTAAGFKAMVEDVGKATGRKGKALFFPVRAALTGAVHGPDLAGLAELRGRDAVLGLLERARRYAAGDAT
jgi:nondiscriminating glutamyl-tRNA synthetase